MNYKQTMVRSLIDQLNALDLSTAPNFKLRVQIKNSLMSKGMPLAQAQKLAMGMEVEISEDTYEEIGEPLMTELVEALTNTVVQLNTASIAAGLGPIGDAAGLSLKFN